MLLRRVLEVKGLLMGWWGLVRGCGGGDGCCIAGGEGRREGFEKAEKEGGMPFLESFLAREGDKGAVDGFVQGPLKFTVCYSGLRAPGKRYQGFYEPKIWTPVLHVLGQVDVVVDEASSRQLVEACEGGEGGWWCIPGAFCAEPEAVVGCCCGVRERMHGGNRNKRERKWRGEG